MQYRFFKYLATTVSRAINLLNSNAATKINLLWLSGVVSDFKALCPVDLPAEIESRIISVSNGISRDTDWFNLLMLLREYLTSQVTPVIHVYFMFSRPVGAVHLFPVYEECLRDTRLSIHSVARRHMVNVSVTLPGNELVELETLLRDADISYNLYTDHWVEESLPDIVIETDKADSVSIPPRLTVSQLSIYSNRVVHVPHTFFINEDLRPYDQYNSSACAWLDCCNSEFVYKSRNAANHLSTDNSLVTGHPFYDISYSVRCGSTGKAIPDSWVRKQANRRLTILFNCEHPNKKSVDILKALLDNYPNVLIISRPKPTAPIEYRAFEAQHDSLEKTYDNFIIDRNIDYSFALIAADACISELSSLYPQFIATGKPAAIYSYYTFNDATIPFWLNAPFLKTIKDIFTFIDNLLASENEPISEISAFEQYFIGFTDGNNSKRIKNAVLSKFYHEEKEFIDKYCPQLIPGETML